MEKEMDEINPNLEYGKSLICGSPEGISFWKQGEFICVKCLNDEEALTKLGYTKIKEDEYTRKIAVKFPQREFTPEEKASFEKSLEGRRHLMIKSLENLSHQ